MYRKTVCSIGLALGLVLIPALAMALEMEFYTYGGHDAVVNAFNKVALIFGDNAYKSLFFTLMVAGIFFGGTAFYLKSISGGNAGSAFAWIFPAVIGIIIYIAMIVPKGTVHIYDPVYNRYQAIGNIPDGLVLIAGVTNRIERGLVEIVTTSGDPVGYRTQAGGKGFLGIFQATSFPVSAISPYLDESMRRFITDCVTPALADSGSGLTVTELRKNTPDLMASLEKAVNPALMTMYFDDTNVSGLPVSCTDSVFLLKTEVMKPETLKETLNNACSAMGFDINTASEVIECKTRLNEINTGMAIVSPSIDDFIRQNYLAKRLEEVYRSGDATGAANYAFLLSASGSMKSANEWVPIMKAALTAIAIALVPFMALFIPTPLFGRGIGIVAGLFVWLAAWGVTDAIIHQFAIDYANKAYEMIKTNQMGMDTFYFFPNQTTKILGMFGTLRMSGMMLATVITGALVKFGGHAMAMMAGNLSGQLQGAGLSGTMKTEDAAGRAGAINQNMGVMPTAAWTNQYSHSERAASLTAAKVSGTADGLGKMAAVGGDFRNLDAVSRFGGYQTMSKMQGDQQNYAEGAKIAASDLGFSAPQIQALQARHVSGKGFRDEMAAVQERVKNDPAGTGLSGARGQALFDRLQDGFTMAATPGVQTGFADNYGSWQLKATHDPGSGASMATISNGQQSMNWSRSAGGGWLLTGITGANNRIGGGESWRIGASNNLKNAIQETEATTREVGSGMRRTVANSQTGSEAWNLSSGIRISESGSTTLKDEINNQTGEALKRASKVTDSDGREVSQSAWASIATKLGLGTPAASPVQAGFGADGGMRYQVSTKDGTTYTIDLGKEKSESLNESVGKVVQDTYERVKTNGADHTTSTNLARLMQLSNTTDAAEKLSSQRQAVNAMERTLSSSHETSTGAMNDLDKGFYSFLAKNWSGEVNPQTVASALARVEQMRPADIQAAQNAFLLSDPSLMPSASRLPEANGLRAPDEASAPVMGTADELYKEQWQTLNAQQAAMPQPNAPSPSNVGRRISSFSPSNGVTDITATPPNGHSQENQVRTKFSLMGADMRVAREDWVKSMYDFGGLFNLPGAQQTTAEQLSNGEGPNGLSFLTPVNRGIGILNQGARSIFGANSLTDTDLGLGPQKPLDRQLGDSFRQNIGYTPPASGDFYVPDAGSASKGALQPPDK